MLYALTHKHPLSHTHVGAFTFMVDKHTNVTKRNLIRMAAKFMIR